MTTPSAASTASPPPPDRPDAAVGDGPPSHQVTVRDVTDAPRDAAGRIDLDRLVRALDDADLFESASGSGGWSYVVPRIGPRLLDDGRHVGWVLPDGRWVPDGSDPFAAIDRFASANGTTPHAATAGAGAPPFTGGLVGAVAYEAVHRVERVPSRARSDRPTPWLSLRVAPVVVAVAPGRDRVLVIGRALHSPGWELTGRALDTAMTDATARLSHAATDRSPVTVDHPRAAPTTPVRSSMTRDGYRAAVTAALEAIAAGDAFQVNLAHRLTGHTDRSTHGLYRDLRAASPAPHGAALADVGIASVSPETFLRVDGTRVTIRPIKGTRARATDARVDAAQADDLVTSAKDHAENVMVVDLERNDLGRVCEVGSVRVPTLCRLEAHPTVWHLTSEVTGTLADGTGHGDLLRATFPCGSITGAPKLAAIGLIDRLEPVTRGWYCGAIGMLGAGHASWSVAIRTATRFGDGTVDHAVGAGIVADSDPDAEHAETLAKAQAFLTAVGGRPTVDVTGAHGHRDGVTGRSGRPRRATRAAG